MKQKNYYQNQIILQYQFKQVSIFNFNIHMQLCDEKFQLSLSKGNYLLLGYQESQGSQDSQGSQGSQGKDKKDREKSLDFDSASKVRENSEIVKN